MCNVRFNVDHPYKFLERRKPREKTIQKRKPMHAVYLHKISGTREQQLIVIVIYAEKQLLPYCDQPIRSQC